MNTDYSQPNTTSQRPAPATSSKTLESPLICEPDAVLDSPDNGGGCSNGVCAVGWKPARPAA